MYPAAVTSPPGNELIGQSLAGYLLEARIGAGATGVVYRASDREGRPVAIKLLNQNLGQIASLRRRFEREARALSKLTHPRIVHITDFGITDEWVFIAMDLLQGDTLEDILVDGPVAVESAVEIVRQALEGLAFAHERQIVHRDLKPANVFVELVGNKPDVKVLDFGLAKFLSVEELSEDSTLTRRGRIVGTPAYMAPEQITGTSIDVRADVYAAGVLLFELLADRRPFDYPKRAELLRAHLFEPVPRITSMRSGLEVRPALEAIIRKALEKDPGKRYANAGEMLAALAKLPENSARLTPAAAARSYRRHPSVSALISSSERRQASTSSGLTASVEAVALGSGQLPLETMEDRLPLGSLPPPGSADLARTERRERRVLLLWWVVGMSLSLGSGVLAFLVVRAFR